MLVNFNPAVSSVRFGNGNNVNDILSRPGAFSRPDSASEPAPEKKKSGIGKKVLKLAVAAAVIAGGLVLLNKKFPSVFKTTLDSSATGWKKYLNYVTTGIGKAGEYISDNCLKLWNKISPKKP